MLAPALLLRLVSTGLLLGLTLLVMVPEARAQADAPTGKVNDRTARSVARSILLKPVTYAAGSVLEERGVSVRRQATLGPAQEAINRPQVVVGGESGMNRRTAYYVAGGVLAAGLVTTAVLLLTGGDGGGNGGEDDGGLADPPGRPN